MKIISKLIEIEKKELIGNKFIESELAKINIYPLRWAIVGVKGNIIQVSVAFESL